MNVQSCFLNPDKPGLDKVGRFVFLSIAQRFRRSSPFKHCLYVMLIVMLGLLFLGGCDRITSESSRPDVHISTPGVNAKSNKPELNKFSVPVGQEFWPSDSIEFSIMEIPLEQAELYYQDRVSQEKLSGIASATQSGLKFVHILPRFGTQDGELTSGVYMVLPPGEALVGYLRLVNTLTYAHEFGMLATLNYVPIPIQFNQHPQGFPRIHLEPGNERAFQFFLQPLPEGVYVLALTLLIAPDRSFAPPLEAEAFDPVAGEALTFLGGPFEFSLLIWVTAQTPQSPLDWPEQVRYLPPEETMSIMDSTIIKKDPVSEEPGLLLSGSGDTVQAGQTVTYYARFAGIPSTAVADIPVRMLVLWDDQPTQTGMLSVPTQMAIAADYIPYSIQVPATLAEGEHSLTILAYPYPYYLRWWGDGSEWHPASNPFSVPMARLSVTVVAP